MRATIWNTRPVRGWRVIVGLMLAGWVSSASSALASEAAVFSNGVRVEASSPVASAMTATPISIQAILTPPAGATVINFDDVTAPSGFSQTVAARDEYAALGVHFVGPATKDGAAILNQASNFGVSGFSTPNFLAINPGAQLSDGGLPRGPQRINFTPSASLVQVNVGSGGGAGTQVTMTAYDVGNNTIGSAQLTLASALDTLRITAPGIAYVTIDAGSANFVMDDLAFVPQSAAVAATPVPTLGEFALLLLGLMLAGAGAGALRRERY